MIFFRNSTTLQSGIESEQAEIQGFILLKGSIAA